jgi:tellurium resistance protein TerD
MVLHASTGKHINLNRSASAIQEIWVGLGWDISDSNEDFDLDTSAFMLGKNGRLPSDDFFVYYNNLIAPDGSLEHKGDNRTGDGEGNDEVLLVKLNRTSPDITEILFVVSIYEFKKRNQNFGKVKNAYIRIYDVSTKEEIVKYELNHSFKNESAIIFAKLYKKNKEWFFEAVGKGNERGLAGFLERYM